jgi:hypothetical protein
VLSPELKLTEVYSAHILLGSHFARLDWWVGGLEKCALMIRVEVRLWCCLAHLALSDMVVLATMLGRKRYPNVNRQDSFNQSYLNTTMNAIS